MFWQHSVIDLRTSKQARREPERDLGKLSPKHFRGASLGRKYLNFSFQNNAFLRTLYVFLNDSGAPNDAEPEVTYSLYPTLSTACI